MLHTLISCVLWYVCSAGEKHNADRHQKWWRDVSCYRVRSSRSLPWTDAETVAGFRNWHVSWVHFSSSTPAAFSLVRHKGENENKNEREREKRPQCRRSRFQQQTNCFGFDLQGRGVRRERRLARKRWGVWHLGVQADIGPRAAEHAHHLWMRAWYQGYRIQ